MSMTKHAIAPEVLKYTVASALGELVQHIDVARGEVTVSVSAGEYHQVMRLLRDPDGYVYVCGLKAMEAGVLAAFREVCAAHGADWEALRAELLANGRLHIETY